VTDCDSAHAVKAAVHIYAPPVGSTCRRLSAADRQIFVPASEASLDGDSVKGTICLSTDPHENLADHPADACLFAVGPGMLSSRSYA
jgi:hypothetical protein